MSPPDRFWTLLKKYGRNSNSFVSAYEGYSYFESDLGIVGYVETSGAWVGAADPLCAPEHLETLLAEFAGAAKKIGKTVLLVGVRTESAKAAEKVGYGSVMIGSDPIIELDHYTVSLSRLPTAKRISAKGAVVSEFFPDRLSPAELAELDAIKDEWIASRDTEELSFLNRVEPWTLAPKKKFFLLRLGDQVQAFIAAVPIAATGGWYFLDIMRRTHSLAGTSELLILEAMRALHGRGAREISLGISPLSNLDPAAFVGNERGLKILQFLRRSLRSFYNFDSLHAFKAKFQPTRSDSVFLVYSATRFSPNTVKHMLAAFFPKGILRAFRIGFVQAFRHWNFDQWILSRLNADVVPRSTPIGLAQRFYRSKLTASVVPVQMLLFWNTLNKRHWHLRNSIAKEWAFSGNAFSRDALKSILLSPFLHWDWSHFLFNMTMTVVYCGLLEYLAGTAFLTLCYFIPLVFANPVTYWLLILPMKWIYPKLWVTAFLEPDVGSSLGVYGVIGALVHFFTRGRLLIWGFGVSAALYALLVHSLLPLDHIIAMAMGFLIGGFILSFDSK